MLRAMASRIGEGLCRFSRGCGGIVQPGVSTPGICGDASDGFKPRMRRHRIARRVNAGYVCQSGVPYVAPLGALTPFDAIPFRSRG